MSRKSKFAATLHMYSSENLNSASACGDICGELLKLTVKQMCKVPADLRVSYHELGRMLTYVFWVHICIKRVNFDTSATHITCFLLKIIFPVFVCLCAAGTRSFCSTEATQEIPWLHLSVHLPSTLHSPLPYFPIFPLRSSSHSPHRNVRSDDLR